MNESIAGRSVVPKHLAVERTILTAVQEGRFAQGSRLPGDRALAKSLNVNTLTLQHAMRQLCQQGVLERRPRVGTFVRASAHEPNVALLVFNGGRKDASVSRELLQEMQDEGLARGHQVRPIHLMHPYPPLVQLRNELRAMHAGAVGLLDFLNTDREFVTQLAQLWPCVLLNKGLGVPLPCVTPDMYTAAELIVDYFAARGRTTIAAGVFNILHHRHLELEIALERECIKRGIHVDRRLWQESDSYEFDSGEAWIARLRQEPHPPDALVLCGGLTMTMMETWLRNAGLTPGLELDIVQFRQKVASVQHPYSWPTLCYNDNLASMTAIRLLFDIVEGKTGAQEEVVIRLPVELTFPAGSEAVWRI